MKLKTIASGVTQFAILTFATLLPLPLFARCPITPNGTVVVRAPSGDVQVELVSGDAVETDVSDKLIHAQETCGSDKVVIEGNDARTSGIPQWRIRAPRTVNLDVVAYAGGVTLIGDSDASSVVLRTGGGPVTVGNIKGRTTIRTSGSYIKAGNLGSSAELRSEGNLDVGTIAGDATLVTSHGNINANMVGGKTSAETNGGKITILDARGEINIPNTRGGDIIINNATLVQVETDGGSIHGGRVRGGFKGETSAGGIRVDQAASWVEASTRQGNVEVHMVPQDINGDLHVNLRTDDGDVLLYVPRALRASVEAAVVRPAFRGESIVADFALNSVLPSAMPTIRGIPGAAGGLALGAFSQTLKTAKLGDGKNNVKLHTGFGSIKIHFN